MSDHLHPAIDIPGGGIWEGARITHRTDGDGLTIEEPAPDCLPGKVLCVLPGADMYPRVRLCEVADLSLRLDDPLGLGLAGLAGRVCQRMGWFVGASVEAVSLALADQPWCSPEWEPGPARVREAATLLARLDRLAVAVNPTYTVRSGVVPQWSRLEPVDGDPRHGWYLLAPLPNGGSVGKCFLPLDEPDPIEAAGAALEVCGG